MVSNTYGDRDRMVFIRSTPFLTAPVVRQKTVCNLSAYKPLGRLYSHSLRNCMVNTWSQTSADWDFVVHIVLCLERYGFLKTCPKFLSTFYLSNIGTTRRLRSRKWLNKPWWFPQPSDPLKVCFLKTGNLTIKVCRSRMTWHELLVKALCNSVAPVGNPRLNA